mmetsp:Transcript_18025/g.26676  ORF Transcript_18025/g.26676 Transcript_18025/m.26676 type:complete len:451 (-) Transcript_18025:65-1417(-)
MAQLNNLWEQLTHSNGPLTAEEDEEFNHRFFLRKLQEGIETVRGDNEQSESQSEEPFVFWFVNGIWIMLVVSIAIWFWKFNGVESLSQWMSTDSDEVYHRRLRERREAKKNEIPPEVRRKILHQYFRESKVHMIVSKSNILSDVISTSNSLIKNEDDLRLNCCAESDEASCFGNTGINRSAIGDQHSAELLVTAEEKKSSSCDLPDDSIKAPSTNINGAEGSEPESVNEIENVNYFAPAAEDNQVECDLESSMCDIEVGNIDTNDLPSSAYKEIITDDEHSMKFDKGSSYSDVEVGENSESDKEVITVQTKVMETIFSETNDVEAGESMVVGLCRLKTSLDAALDEEENFNESGLLVIPAKNGDRRVPNNCAVCLGAYEIGDDVVWSENASCMHAFHEECVTEWLLKMQDGNPCPCCRSVFVDMEQIKPAKKNIFSKWVSRLRGNADSDE